MAGRPWAMAELTRRALRWHGTSRRHLQETDEPNQAFLLLWNGGSTYTCLFSSSKMWQMIFFVVKSSVGRADTEIELITWALRSGTIDGFPCFQCAIHISLEQNLTIRSHDGGKEGHFCKSGDTSIHLPLTRSAQPSGQLSLYLLNEFNSL